LDLETGFRNLKRKRVVKIASASANWPPFCWQPVRPVFIIVLKWLFALVRRRPLSAGQ
jgi:hypothetical protein